MDRSIAIAHALRWPIAIAWALGTFGWLVTLGIPLMPMLSGGWNGVTLSSLAGTDSLHIAVQVGQFLSYSALLITLPFWFLPPHGDWLQKLGLHDKLPTRARAITALFAGAMTAATLSAALATSAPEAVPSAVAGIAGTWIATGVFAISWMLFLGRDRERGPRYETYYRWIAYLMLAGVVLWLGVVPLVRYRVTNTISFALEASHPAVDTLAIIAVTVVLWAMGAGAILLFALVPYIRWQSRLCMACGYDLHATIDDGHKTCPECGHEIEQITAVGDSDADAPASASDAVTDAP